MKSGCCYAVDRTLWVDAKQFIGPSKESSPSKKVSTIFRFLDCLASSFKSSLMNLFLNPINHTTNYLITPAGGDKWLSESFDHLLNNLFNNTIQLRMRHGITSSLIAQVYYFFYNIVHYSNSSVSRSHWFIHSNDSFKNIDSFRNETILLCISGFVWQVWWHKSRQSNWL